jgi:peptidoglycan/LPS O-acetylase OafA/YrhL
VVAAQYTNAYSVNLNPVQFLRAIVVIDAKCKPASMVKTVFQQTLPTNDHKAAEVCNKKRMSKLDNRAPPILNQQAKMLKLTPNSLTAEASVFLNIVRLIACELVLVSHFFTRYQPKTLDSIFFGGMLGGIGVFLFFSISGFLISYSLLQKLQNKQYSFRHYFIDRFSRIYFGLLPALIFTAAITGAIALTNSVYFNYLSETESAPNAQNFVATLAMIVNFPTGLFNLTANAALDAPFTPPTFAPFGFNAVLWSLVVEWWIYMFFGWLVIGGLAFFGIRKKPHLYKGLFLAVAAILSTVLVALAWDYSAFIVVWFLGVAMMCVVSNTSVRSKLTGHRATKIVAILLCASLVAVTYEGYVIYTLTHESFNLLFGVLIATSVFLTILLLSGNANWLSRHLLKKSVAKYSGSMAAFSYTLFLIHYPMLLFLNGLNFEVDRFLLFIPIVLLINEVAFCLATVGEKNHKKLAGKLKSALHISPV